MKAQSNTVIQAIFKRRSIGRLAYPAPSETDLITILRAGAAAPDHKRTHPFWFVILEGKSREEFGEVMASSLAERVRQAGKEASLAELDKERKKLTRAPLVIVVAARRHPGVTLPGEELVASAAAAAQNMLIASTSLGYGSMWRTGDAAYDPAVKKALGLGDEDYIVGFLYFGTISDGSERGPNEPRLESLVSVWEG